MGKIVRNGVTLASFNYTHEGTLITKSITANDTYNASDDNADGYSSVTVNVQPSLITKSITANGTYDAEDDNADGYSSVSVNIPSGFPYTVDRDIWGAINCPKRNSNWAISDWQEEVNGSKTQIQFEMHSTSGYEGFCVKMPYTLTSGTSYNLTFTFVTPDTTVINSSYQWGCKWSATEIASSGYNTTPDVDFARTTGEQNVTLPFTADTDNYFVMLLAGLNNNPQAPFLIKNIQISEAT